ncbi:citrate lyase acyl carrier protein [Ruminococcaceae bacterium OttesenSCG-928-A11]|nr:citrate lyase acyl carrier protein [Ruminococcaceae bacterium OttesenSCG-928-A11]
MNIIQTATAGTMESSDMMVTLEPGAGGLVIELDSTVEQQYGDDIRRVLRETLAGLGVTDARVTAVDRGALDCVIRARAKTAAHRACGAANYHWEDNP